MADGASAKTSIPKSSSMHTVNGLVGERNLCAALIPLGSSHFGVAHGLRSSSTFCHCQQGMAEHPEGDSSTQLRMG